MQDRKGLILILVITLALPAMAANHYVRAGATGNGSGNDWTNACTDFTGSCAVASLVRGDTYYVADGNYAVRSFNRATSGTLVITIKKATIADHGTDVGWLATFGDGQALFSNGNVGFNSSYWVFDGQTGGGPGNWKTGFGFKVLNTGQSPVVDTWNANHIVLRHFEAQGNGGDGDGTGAANDGVAMGGDCANTRTDITVEYAYVHHTGRTIFFIASDDIKVQYSWLQRPESTPGQHAEGVSAWCGTIGVRNLTFANNVWEDMQGTGVIVMAGDGLQVYGNIFWKSSDRMGNGVVTTWTADSLSNAKVYNNSFIDVDSPGVSYPSNVTTGNVAYNNIFYNVNAGFQNLQDHDFNVFFNAGGTWAEANGQSISSDPFVNRLNADFHLLSQTNGGKTLPAPYNVDADGDVRGSDGVWDRGAFEFGGTPRPAAPSGLAAVVR